jgi:hypothetical protein
MQCACVILPSVACRSLRNFSTLSKKLHDFRKNLTEHKMCVSSFYTSSGWNIFHSKKNWARCDPKYILVFVSSTRYSCQTVTKTWIFWILKIILKYQMSWKSVQWEPSCCVRACVRAWGRTDRHDEANSRFSQFFEPPKNANTTGLLL